MKPKMLVFAQYFYPDVASLAQLMTDLCASLADRFDITVVCSAPCYLGEVPPEYMKQRLNFGEHAGVKVIRVRVTPFDKTNKLSRVKNMLALFFNSLAAARACGRQDIVFTTTNPPILGGLLGALGKRITGGKLVYNIQDFCPEQMMAVGYMDNKALMRASMALDKRVCRRSDLMILVGRDQVETLEGRFKGKNLPKYVVINNWIDEKQVYPLPKSEENVAAFRREHGMDGKFVVMSSGNMGLFYDYDNLMKVIKRFKGRDDVVFAFVGEGAKKRDMMDYAAAYGMDNVRFIPYQDKERLIYSLNAADAHLVANAKGIKGVSVPSKIYGVLATNVPIIGVLEPGSEAWRIIEESGAGLTCVSGDYEGIATTLSKVLDEKEAFVAAHSTGRAYLEKRFTQERSSARYAESLNGLIGGR